MANATDTKRLHDLDALRAFAMLLGILIHGVMSFMPLPITVNATQDIYQDSPLYGWTLSAIHGFRMPLFFLVSGMFTALLWKRRGMGGLIKHRMFRIGLPLLIGVFTLVPVVFTINIFLGRNIWVASINGDTSYVDSYIAAGRDLEVPLVAETMPANGGLPLHLAAANGRYEIAEKLLDAGANIDSQALQLFEGQPTYAPPLHWAAFMQDSKMVQLLLDRGAELNAVDARGLTAFDILQGSPESETLALIAAAGGVSGSTLNVPPAEAKINPAGQSTDSNTETDYLGNWIRSASIPIQLFALGCFFPAFVHLWFLWYLLWLLAAFVIITWMLERLKVPQLPAWLFQGPLFWCWVLPPTFAVQLLMVQSFGPDTASGLFPWPPTLIYYSIFFGFGALYQQQASSKSPLGEHFAISLALATVVLPIGIYAVAMRYENYWYYQTIGSFAATVYAWLMIVGLFGTFRKLFANENPRVRYLSDASYWIYLLHLPIVECLQAWVCDWQIASPVKLLFIIVTTFAITLATYALFVRYTWIGAILHGRKQRPRAEESLPQPQGNSSSTRLA